MIKILFVCTNSNLKSVYILHNKFILIIKLHKLIILYNLRIIMVTKCMEIEFKK